MDLLNNGGIIKTIIKESNSDQIPISGDKVEVHYIGTLENGKKFDSSRDRKETFLFILDAGEVISGWDIGLASMKLGEISKFFIRSDYAYGEQGIGKDIGKNCNLYFEIELISINKDRIQKNILIKGEGEESPVDGADIRIDYKIIFNNEIIEEKKDYQCMMNDGLLLNEIYQLLEYMKKGEKIQSKIILKESFHHLLKNSMIDIELQLNDFEKLKFNFEMNNDEILNFSKKQKDAGNKFYKEKKIDLALKQYEKSKLFLKNDYKFDENDKKIKSNLEKDLNLNMSICHLLLKDYNKSISLCDQVLMIDPKNIKALYRRAQSLMKIQELDLAKLDLNQALIIDPNNKEIKNSLDELNILMKKRDDLDKIRFKNLFIE